MLKKQLKEVTEQQGKGDNKLQSVTSNLRSLQEEKSKLASVCSQKEAMLNALVSGDIIPICIKIISLETQRTTKSVKNDSCRLLRSL